MWMDHTHFKMCSRADTFGLATQAGGNKAFVFEFKKIISPWIIHFYYYRSNVVIIAYYASMAGKWLKYLSRKQAAKIVSISSFLMFWYKG